MYRRLGLRSVLLHTTSPSTPVGPHPAPPFRTHSEAEVHFKLAEALQLMQEREELEEALSHANK